MTAWAAGKARRVLVADVIVPQDYVRISLDDDAVELYKHVIRNPSQHLPPIVVGTDRTLHDGRHRLEAYRLESLPAIEAVVEAALKPKYRFLREFELNATNAVHLTAQDRQHAMEALVMKGCTIKEIAKQTPYSETTVKLLTKGARDKKRAMLVDFIMQLYDTGDYTQKEIAAKARVSESTVSRIIAEFQKVNSDQMTSTDEEEDVDEPEEETKESKASNKRLTKANNACKALLASFDELDFKHVTDFDALDQLVRNIGTLERRLSKLKMATYVIAEEEKQTLLEAMTG